MQMTKQNTHVLTKGTNIIGQDNRKRYTINERLYSSTTGVMYLCTSSGRKVALKISDQATTLTNEINVLQAFQKVRAQSLGPSLVDVDYWQTKNGHSYAFYVVEYMSGATIEQFIKKYNRQWLPLLVVKLLDQLEQLHETGYIYGNFTTEQLIITRDLQVCTMNLSSVTKVGCPVHVRARFFDRSSWSLGSSIAAPSYDLFVAAMIVLRLFYRKPFLTTDKPIHQLIKRINELPIAKPYKQCFIKAIFGKYNRAPEMKKDFLQAIIKAEGNQIFLEKDQMYHLRPSLSETHGLFVLSLIYCLGGYALF